ncbi:hypothetical protein HOLleu_28188 [Holothuria leucospilota]|uniref:Uncharacterized protein n=1 Tax=Holothuria leucospilota TaxID=206669 RepID=A0A9Q1BLU5_HOLLE|nr:hypothetical protein HOLleu_28188 [Holothuria leucospilota]
MNLGLPKVSGEYEGNVYAVKNFSDENFTNASRREFMFEQGREILHRSRSDGEVIYSRQGQESEETWYSFLSNAKGLHDEQPRQSISPTVEGEINCSNGAELYDGELPWVVLPKTEFIANCLMSKTSRASVKKPNIDRNQNEQQPSAECNKIKSELSDRESFSVLEREFVENWPLSKASPEPVEMAEINTNQNDQQLLKISEEKGKIGDETLLIVLDDGYQKDKNFKENQQVTQKRSIVLEENGEDVSKRATFYIGSRPNSGKRDQGSTSRTQSQVIENGEIGKDKQGNGDEEYPLSPQQTHCDFYDDIEVILDEPTHRNETLDLSRITDGQTSPFNDKTKAVTKNSLKSNGSGNTCLISGCDENSLLLPIVSEQPTLPQPTRMEKPVAIRAQPFCSGGSRYNCGEKFSHRNNTEINLISLSSSSESNCSECDSKIKELSKGINEIDLPISVSEEDSVTVFQCPKPSDKLHLMDKTYSPLYTVKSLTDLSLIVTEETKSLNSQEVKNKAASETTTPPLLITVETNPQTIDVDDAGMKNDFHTTIHNPERPTSAIPKHEYESYIAIDHVVPTKLCDEKSAQILNEGSPTNDEETVTDAANRNDVKLGTHFGENVREQPSHEMFRISDGVDPDLIHFFTQGAISPSPPMSAVSESTNTSVDNEVADIMNTGSDDYVIEFKSESSNDWTISSAESDVGNTKAPLSFDRKNDKDIYVESRQVPATSPEPFQAYPPKEFLIDIYQSSENIYNKSLNLSGREEFRETEERTIKVHNDEEDSCTPKAKNQPYGTDEQSYGDEDRLLISISPFKPPERENNTPENMHQGGDIRKNEPSVKVYIDKSSIDRNQYNKINAQENVPAKSDDLTNKCDKLKTEKPLNTRRTLENIENHDFQPLERTTDSESLLEKLPSVPSEPPTVFRKEESSLDMKHVLVRNVDPWPAIYEDVVSLTAATDDDVGSAMYPELDIFAKARLRQGGLYHWEMNCLLTELSREQEENKRLARDSKRAMQEFLQVKKEVENILSKFGSQICVEML